MTFRFVGGPLGGREFDDGQINAVADVVLVWTERGGRQFLLMPPPAGCERALAGGSTKADRGGPRTAYERVWLPDGGAEYREADAAFQAALQPPAPPDAATVRRKAAFAARADELAGRLRATPITAGTAVTLVCHNEFPDGRSAGCSREDVTPTTRVTCDGDPDYARRFAERAHRDAIIEGVDHTARHAPTGLLTFPGHGGLELRLCGFDVEVG